MKKLKRRSRNDASTHKKRKKSFRISFFKMSVSWLMFIFDIVKLVKKIIELFK